MLGKYFSADLVIMKSITNLHVGTGKGGEVVDLPIQRDSYGFPTIYSSSLKGAIKSYVYHLNGKFADVLFGPDESGEFSSPISLTDAFLLAFPARSLKGVYCYLTCPFLLKRFKEFADLIGYQFGEKIEKLIENPPGIACDQSANLKIDNKIIINEELELKNVQDNEIVKELRSLLGLDKELLIINDNECLQQAERSLIRLTRVKLNRESKTVGAGPWTEEYVPSKTIFFFVFYFSLPSTSTIEKYSEDIKRALNKDQSKMNVNDIVSYIHNNLKVLIIGGHETIGSGIVSLYEYYSKPSEVKIGAGAVA
jgi:CRISPR-associated protein Cmr4